MTLKRYFNRLARDEKGAVLVEATVMMGIFLVFILGSIEFLFVFYQYNAATKATQVGARLAAVSDPVALGLSDLSNKAEDQTSNPGAPMPFYEVTCDGASKSCQCQGFCTGVNGFDEGALNTIVFGRASGSCSDAKSIDSAGMCDLFPRISPGNVTITYIQTGLGYIGRPGRPSPTVILTLKDLSFQFFFLPGLLGIKNIPISSSTSVTGEDLSSAAPL